MSIVSIYMRQARTATIKKTCRAHEIVFDPRECNTHSHQFTAVLSHTCAPCTITSQSEYNWPGRTGFPHSSQRIRGLYIANAQRARKIVVTATKRIDGSISTLEQHTNWKLPFVEHSTWPTPANTQRTRSIEMHSSQRLMCFGCVFVLTRRGFYGSARMFRTYSRFPRVCPLPFHSTPSRNQFD